MQIRFENTHIETKHFITLEFKCTLCDKKVSNEENFKRHAKSVHDKKKYICLASDEIFDLETELYKDRIIYCHAEEKTGKLEKSG